MSSSYRNRLTKLFVKFLESNMWLLERHYVPEWPIASGKEELSWYATMSEVDIINSFNDKSS